MSGQKADIEQLLPVLEKIGRDNSLENVKIEFKGLTNKGDGHVGSINFIDIIGTKNGRKEVLEVAIKCAPQNQQVRKAIDVNIMFVFEKFMYTEVLKTFSQLEEKHKIKNNFNSIAKCYFASDEEFREMLVFENLKANGFQLKPYIFMNEAHLNILMKEYGKFHALSFALKHFEPQSFNKLTEKLSISVLINFFNVTEKARRGLYSRIENYIKAGCDPKVTKSFMALLNTKILERLDKIMLYRDQYAVITHGDCWNNNFMFKYNEDQTSCPSEVKILDWQCSLHTSPGIEVGNIFFAGCDPNLYKDYKKFLEIYYDSLSQHLKQFGLDANKVFPFEELMKQWNLGVIYGITIAACIFKVMILTTEEKTDLSQEFEGDDNPMNTFFSDFPKSKEQMVKLKLLIEFLYKEGLLDSAVKYLESILTEADLNEIRLESALKQVAEKEELQNYKINIKNTANKGDGYTGIIVFAEIKGQYKEKEKVLNVILKYAREIPIEEIRKNMEAVFELETYLYATVFKEYSDFEVKHNIKQTFNSFPKFYMTVKDKKGSIIILENLKAIGFDLYDRKKHMNTQHLEFVLGEYAKLHGIALAMKKLEPERFAKLCTKVERSHLMEFLEKEEKSFQNNYQKIANYIKENVSAEIAEKIIKQSKNLHKTISESMQCKNDFSVISHGDSWTNNMMFKYDNGDYTCPSKMCLLDFQCSLLTSPAIDLVYFFYACGSSEQHKNYEHFLKVYHGALDKHLKNFKLTAKDVFSFDDLKKEWARCSKFAFYMATMVFKVQLVNTDEAPNIDNVKKDGDVMESFFADFSRSDEVNQRLGDLARHLHENGFI